MKHPDSIEISAVAPVESAGVSERMAVSKQSAVPGRMAVPDSATVPERMSVSESSAVSDWMAVPESATASDSAAARAAENRAGQSAHAGRGELTLSLVAGKTAVTRLRADSPLKLLAPRSRRKAAWVFASAYGGGLLAGDDIRIDADLGAGTTCLLGTQASTKIFRSPDQRPCRQTLSVAIGSGALCVAAPHPVTCFARARFVQRQRFDLAAGASLVLVDWLTSGRQARGERWAFDVYDSRTDVVCGDRLVFRDALRLDAHDGPIAAPHRTGGMDCFAYAVVLGDGLADRSRAILHRIEERPASEGEDDPLLVAASAVAGGVVIRAAGKQTQTVGRWLRQQLDFVPSLLGDDPWARLW